MDVKEIDLSHLDEYTCNVDLTKEELDWVYAYLHLTDDTGEVGRETLAKVCKNVEGMDAAQTLCLRLVMWTTSKLLREGAKKVRVTADDGWSTAYPVTDGRGAGLRADMDTLGKDDVEAVAAMAKMKRACDYYGEDFTALVHLMGFMSSLDLIRLFHLTNWFFDMKARDLVTWLKGGDDPCVETKPRVYQTILTNEETWRGEDGYQDKVERGYFAKPEDGGETDRVSVGRGSCKAYVATVIDTSSKDNSPFKGIHQLTDEEGKMCNPFKTVSDLTDEQVEKVKATFMTEDDGFNDRLWDYVSEQMQKAAELGTAVDKAAVMKQILNSIYGASAAKLVHPDEDCVLPGCDRYGGNDTYLRIRKVLGHKGAFDFCMGNVVKLVDRWDKKGDPMKNLEKLRDYSAQALVEWRLYNEMLS